MCSNVSEFAANQPLRATAHIHCYGNNQEFKIARAVRNLPRREHRCCFYTQRELEDG